MDLRPLEPEDLKALRALCEEPLIARDLDWDLASLDKLVPAASGPITAIGAFEGGMLVGAAGLSAMDRPRMRHIGRAWLACRKSPQNPAAQLMKSISLLAHDWWKLDRVEISLPATSLLHDEVALHFNRELVRRRDFALEGELVDTWVYAWIRPGVVATPSERPFPRSPKGPIPASFEIRATRLEDGVGFARVLADPTVIWGTLQSPFTPNIIWRERLRTNDPDRNKTFVAVVDGEIVANGGLHGAQGPRRRHVWMLGMGIREGWQGRGIGAAMMERFMETADALRIARVELDVYVDNTRAVLLYEKFGFVREGVKRLESWRDGAYADGLVMARIR